MSKTKVPVVRQYLAFDMPVLEGLRVLIENRSRKLGLSTKKGGSPAHITIKGRLFLNPTEKKWFIQKLQNLAYDRDRWPSQVHFEGVGFFEDVRNIHMQVKDAVFVSAWRKLIDELARYGYQKLGFEGSVAHTTLLDDISKKNWESAKNFVADMIGTASFDAPLRSLVLYEKINNESQWRTGERILLHP